MTPGNPPKQGKVPIPADDNLADKRQNQRLPLCDSQGGFLFQEADTIDRD